MTAIYRNLELFNILTFNLSFVLSKTRFTAISSLDTICTDVVNFTAPRPPRLFGDSRGNFHDKQNFFIFFISDYMTHGEGGWVIFNWKMKRKAARQTRVWKKLMSLGWLRKSFSRGRLLNIVFGKLEPDNLNFARCNCLYYNKEWRK